MPGDGEVDMTMKSPKKGRSDTASTASSATKVSVEFTAAIGGRPVAGESRSLLTGERVTARTHPVTKSLCEESQGDQATSVVPQHSSGSNRAGSIDPELN